ncbi:MAG TPA: glutamine synthetase family protein [Thermomicrobiales bacterium]|nr:glutamine synthetase family protein [Thermomicrobiales bacterium]
MTVQQLDQRESVIAQAIDAELRLVRFLYCDYGSIVRGKATHASHLRQRMDEGIALVIGQIAMNALDALQPVPGMTAVGEVRLVPDPDSFAPLPYAPRTGSMMCDLLTLDRKPWVACPRAFLRRVIERAAARGMRVEAAFENEFYLAREVDGRYVPFDDSLCFSTIGMDSTAAFTDDLIDALAAQGIVLEQALSEYGPGQQEISIRHAPALRAADNQIRVRETARVIAARHGAIASFAPKPFPDLIGSGAHCHLSLWDTSAGSNLFYSPTDDANFSATGRYFVGGLLDHLPALAAVCCPTVNSYRRLQPHAWASAFICWGFDNREAAVRVPSPFWGREQATTNLEVKTVDNTCNPYLALGAIITAGLDGIERGLDPGPSLDIDPGLIPADERAHRGIRQLPASLDEALDNLEADDVLLTAMGETLANAYIQVRRSEADAYREQSPEFEFAQHFRKY